MEFHPSVAFLGCATLGLSLNFSGSLPLPIKRFFYLHLFDMCVYIHACIFMCARALQHMCTNQGTL